MTTNRKLPGGARIRIAHTISQPTGSAPPRHTSRSAEPIRCAGFSPTASHPRRPRSRWGVFAWLVRPI